MTHCHCPFLNWIAAIPSLLNQYCSGLFTLPFSRSCLVPVLLWSSSCEWCWSLDLLWWALYADTLTGNRMTLFHTSRHWQVTHLFNEITIQQHQISSLICHSYAKTDYITGSKKWFKRKIAFFTYLFTREELLDLVTTCYSILRTSVGSVHSNRETGILSLLLHIGTSER